MLGSNVIGTGEAPAEIFAYLVDRNTRQKHALHEGVNIVGRVNADIQISEATLSRSHAKLTVTSGTIYVEDLGSSNGTKIGNDRLVPGVSTPVEHGTKIRFGMWRTLVQVAALGEAYDDVDNDATAMGGQSYAPPAPVTPPSYEEASQKNVALSYIFGSAPSEAAQDSAPSPFAEPDEEPEPVIGLAAYAPPPANLFGNIQDAEPTPPATPLYDYDATAPPAAESAWVIHGTLLCQEGIAPNIHVMDGPISIGRKVGNDVVLTQDSFVSGRHAILRHDAEGTFLIDIGSTNGTVVNGMRLEPNRPQMLFDGDEVQIGKSRFLFQAKTGA